jgi:hypothetical protein
MSETMKYVAIWAAAILWPLPLALFSRETRKLREIGLLAGTLVGAAPGMIALMMLGIGVLILLGER